MSDAAPVFPPQISYGDLKATHPEYDLTKIEKHNDLYEGGDSFRSHIDRYLLKLQDEMYSKDEIASMYFAGFNPKAESHDQPGEWQNKVQQFNGAMASVGKQLKARQARAWYPPIVAGLLDFIVAAIFQNPPAIVPGDASAKETSDQVELIGDTVTTDTDASPQDYWHAINLNVDGNGTSLWELLRNTLLEILLHRRAYLSTLFDPLAETDGFEAMKAAGGLDARIYLLRAIDVDDWCDDAGALVWIRTHRCSYERSSPEKQPDLERHCWTYITADASYEYEIKFPKGKYPDDGVMVGSYSESGAAQDAIVQAYSTGFPVVKVPCDVGVMDRLADIVLGLFNRQASLTWHLDKAAFSLLVLATKRALATVVDSTLGAVRMDPGDDAKFVSPDMAISDALLKDIERWKDELHSAMQAMVLQAASKDSGDRASGVAKQRDFGALATLLTPLAMGLKQSLGTTVRNIRKVRKDDNVMLTIQGLDKFDVQSIEIKLANVEKFTALNGAPETGKRFALADATLAMMANAPTKAREKALEEVQHADVSQPAPTTGAFGKPSVAPLGSGQKPVNKPIGGKTDE